MPEVNGWSAGLNKIMTFTGKFVNPLSMTEQDVCIEDIAHALAMKCRYSGHCKKFYCVSPETKILTKNLDWVEAGSLRIGDELFGIEETANMQKNKKRTRKKLLPTTVLHDGIIQRPRYKLNLENGDTLISSEEHPWLVATKASGNQFWISTITLFNDIKKGKIRYLPKFMDVWTEETNKNAGWLAGIFDGEGHVSKSSNQIGIGQKPGIVLDKIVSETRLYSEIYCWENPKSGVTQCALRGDWAKKLEFLGRIKPSRLINNFWDNLQKRPPTAEAKELVRIIGVEFLGVGDVVALETSTHTYFAEGYGAHNSVAEHSIYVSLMVPENLALAALLHDAPEAYLCDVAGPIKANFPDFMKYEEGLHEQINLAFDLDLNAQDHPAIKAADKAILWLEVNQLMKNTDTYFREIGCWNWQLAESYFLRRFKELTSTAPLQQQPYAGRPAQGFSSDWNVLLSPGLPSPSLLSLGSDPNLSQKSCGQHCNEGPSESPAIEDLILNHRTSSARNH
jgi:hypothetical protein